LFQRFSQVDGSSTRSKGGTGLGLAICQGLVEAMGGAIRLRSRVGHGTTVRLELPAPVAEAMGCDADAIQGFEVLEGVRLLVVDDNRVNRELVRAMVEPYGVEVSEAADGQDGLEFATELPVDVILMDIRMPRLNGRAAAEAIRNGDGPNRDVPILAFTAGAENLLEGSEPGYPFSGRITKPLEPRDLLSALRHAFGEDPASGDEEGLRHARS
jgi:CheY-like chemotaxis protein